MSSDEERSYRSKDKQKNTSFDEGEGRGAEGKEVATKGAGKESPSEIDKRERAKSTLRLKGLRDEERIHERNDGGRGEGGPGPRGVH